MSNVYAGRNTLNLIAFLLLLFPILINSVKIFGNLILLILLILGIYIAIRNKQNPFKIKELKIFSWLFSGYFLVMLLSILYADGLSAEFHHLGRKVHFLLAPMIALAIFQVDIPIKKILLSIKIGLLILGPVVTVQFLLGHDRPSGMINANIFGDIAVAMFFLSIVKLFEETPREKLFTLFAAFSGLTAILLSDNRGSWLSFLILLAIYLGLTYKPFLQQSIKKQLILLLSILITLGFIATQTGVKQRVSQAVAEIHNWKLGSDSRTSLGLRMEMWESGLQAAKESPWLGYGYRNANRVAADYASNHKQTIRAFTHLHNEYITHLVSAGVIGLLSVLALLSIPLFIFYKKLKNQHTYHYAFMGILLCAGYATFGFTHIAFGEEHINAFYVLFMGLLLPKVLKESYL